jgi:acyl transferase domain-containing protein
MEECAELAVDENNEPASESDVAESVPMSGLRAQGTAEAGTEAHRPWPMRFWSDSSAERSRLLLELVVEQVRAVTGTQGQPVDVEAPWRRLGIHRSAAREFCTRLSNELDRRLAAIVLLDHSTPAALAHHLEAELFGINAETSRPGSMSPRSARSPWRLPVLPYVFSENESATVLRARAEGVVTRWQKAPQLSARDLGYSLSLRPSLQYRAVLFANGRAEAVAAMKALAEGRSSLGCVQGTARPGAKLAFLFTGQGSQRAGMGHVLYEAFPEFAAAFDAVCEQLAEQALPALREHAFAEKGSVLTAQLDRTRYAQAAVFAFEVALFRLLQAWGVAPDFLLGHSLGELAAAHVAGVFSLEDACKLLTAVGLGTQVCRTDGAMLAISAGEVEVARSLENFLGRLEIAMLNGPLETVVAGDAFALAGVAEHWRAQGRDVKALRVNYAFHSRHMDRAMPLLRRAAQTISFAAPTIPLVSSTTGALATVETLTTAEYWVQHVRRAVRFSDGLHTLADNGVTAFVELGPDAALSAIGPSCLDSEQREHSVFASAQIRGRPQVETLLGSLAALFVHGIDVRWRSAFRI